MSDPRRYTEPRAMIAEGARVAFVSCRDCGSALVLDDYDMSKGGINVLDQHDDWHAAVSMHGVPIRSGGNGR